MPPRLSHLNMSVTRHHATLQALQEALQTAEGRKEIDGALIILHDRENGPQVIAAGAMSHKNQAVYALAKTQLGMLSKK